MWQGRNRSEFRAGRPRGGGPVSYPNRLEPPEDDYSDDEWDTAREQLIEERLDLGWSRDETLAHIDDLMVADQCVQNRADRASVWADEEYARRKENR